MKRDKTDRTSQGLDSEGTLRGICRREVSTDDPLQWRKWTKAEELQEGRDFRLIGTAANQLQIRGLFSFLETGDLRWAFAAGDVITVRGAGAANGTYTVVSTAWNTAADPNQTDITVVESVGSPTLDFPNSLVTTTTIRWPSWLTYAISSHTTGANPDVTIPDPELVVPSDSPLYYWDMFLDLDVVRISDSYQGLNDGEYECRSDYTDPGGSRIVHLDGYLNAIPPGEAKGNLTLVLPTPLSEASGRYFRAVSDWYRSTVVERAALQCRYIDSLFASMFGADLGPALNPEPE